MSGPLRHVNVIDQLLAAPQQYCWRQAMRLLLGWLHQQGVPPETALLQVLRFDNSVSPRFPASQIEAIRLIGTPGDGALPRIYVTPTFMGLLGNHGVLPGHYSERLASHQASEHDEAPRAFLDLFSSRALTLFYQAWEKYRIEQGQARQHFLPHLLNLAGHPANAATGVDPRVIGLYSGLLQQRHVSATIMARILSAHFDIPVTVRETSGAMLALTLREQTALGGTNALLGRRAMLGQRCLRPDLAVTVRLGPLSAAQYASFLPRAPASRQLAQLLKLFGQPLLQVQIDLLLRADAMHPVRLGQPSAGALGCNSFLGQQAGAQARDDMHYSLQLMAALGD